MTDLGSGVQMFTSNINAGTGNYDSFVRIQNTGEEDGFNTDTHKQLDNKDGNWTHSLLLSSLQVVTVGGIDYYQIRLDLNETNSNDGPNITLQHLTLYSGQGTDAASLSGLTSVFDLATPQALVDHNSGSGSDDYYFMIPTSLFPAGTQYLTLYADFQGADGGFEEFRALSNPTTVTPGINLVKTADHTTINEGTPTDVTYTYTLTNTSNQTDPLQLSTLVDDNGTPLNTADDIDLLSGVDALHPYGAYYTGGDTNLNGLLDNTETWTFSYTATGLDMNAGDTRHNIASVTAVDSHGTNVSSNDDWTVTATDVLPKITLVKDVNHTHINEGTPTDVTYTYTLTSQSTDTDPLTVTSLLDDNGTPLNLADDIQLVTGVDLAHPLGIYYTGGDTNNDGLLENDETWTYQYTLTGLTMNAGQHRHNIAVVTAHDDELHNVTSQDDADVVADDVLPDIHITKVASPTQVQAGTATDVTFTYVITNTSSTSTDPLTLDSLVDDNGTPGDTSDDVNLLVSGTFVGGDSNSNGLLDKGESWTFTYTESLTLNPGDVRTNTVLVYGHDDEDNSVHDDATATVTAYNLGRTPGFWANLKNGGLLWDGNDTSWPKGGNLGITSPLDPSKDIAYGIKDLNGDGIQDNSGNRAYLMIGDWNHDGIADNGENVLVVSRADALSLLNASDKQQQDGRWILSRDLVASWLNTIGGSFAGSATDPSSVRHYIDEATAWLIQTGANHDHVLSPTTDFTSGTKVPTNSAAWTTGLEHNGIPGIQNDVPLTGDTLGMGTTLDVLGGGMIHSGLDHYNNFGFI